MQRYDHPSIINGRISFEDQEFEVVDGVVECPASLAIGADWPLTMKPAPDKAVAPATAATGPVSQLVMPTNVPQGWQRLEGGGADLGGGISVHGEASSTPAALIGPDDDLSNATIQKIGNEPDLVDAETGEILGTPIAGHLAGMTIPFSSIDPADTPDTRERPDTDQAARHAEVLNGTVADVAAYVDQVSDAKALNDLYALENAGKHRKGVADAIEARMSSLGTD